jgi:hypothetical protein
MALRPQALSESHEWSEHHEHTNKDDCERAYRLRSIAQRAPQRRYRLHGSTAKGFRSAADMTDGCSFVN